MLTEILDSVSLHLLLSSAVQCVSVWVVGTEVNDQDDMDKVARKEGRKKEAG